MPKSVEISQEKSKIPLLSSTGTFVPTGSNEIIVGLIATPLIGIDIFDDIYRKIDGIYRKDEHIVVNYLSTEFQDREDALSIKELLDEKKFQHIKTKRIIFGKLQKKFSRSHFDNIARDSGSQIILMEASKLNEALELKLSGGEVSFQSAEIKYQNKYQ